MATPKRKAEEDAERDGSDAKQARVPDLETVEDDPSEPEGEPAPANGKGYIACLHDVSNPEGYDHGNAGRISAHTKPAKEYPFTLDPFQREAIRCLEAGESVLVCSFVCIRLSSRFFLVNCRFLFTALFVGWKFGSIDVV